MCHKCNSNDERHQQMLNATYFIYLHLAIFDGASGYVREVKNELIADVEELNFFLNGFVRPYLTLHKIGMMDPIELNIHVLNPRTPPQPSTFRDGLCATFRSHNKNFIPEETENMLTIYSVQNGLDKYVPDLSMLKP